MVHRHTPLAAQPTKAAAEGEPGDAGGGVDPNGSGKAKGLCLVVEVAKRCSGPHLGPVLDRVNPDGFHKRQINHEAAVAHGASGDVVPAAANRDEQIVLPGKGDGSEHCWQPAKVGHFETRAIRDRERAW